MNLFNKHDIDTEMIFASEDGNFTFKQMKDINRKVPYNNVDAAGGDVSLGDVEKVLKSAVSYL